MTKYTAAIVLFALIGIGLCGFAASQAKATTCNTFCNDIGGFRYCTTNCF